MVVSRRLPLWGNKAGLSRRPNRIRLESSPASLHAIEALTLMFLGATTIT